MTGDRTKGEWLTNTVQADEVAIQQAIQAINSGGAPGTYAFAGAIPVGLMGQKVILVFEPTGA